MVSCLACGVPTVVSTGGNHSGILRRALFTAKSIMITAGILEAIIREFHLTINFPQLWEPFLQEKARKKGTGCALGWGQYSPGEQWATSPFKFQ